MSYPKNATGGTIYLAGASNAYHFSDAFIQAAEKLSRPLIIGTARACPFVDLYFLDKRPVGYTGDSCRHYVQESLEYLKGAKPGLVFISNSTIYWESPEFEVGRTNQQSTKDTEQKVEIFHEALGKTTTDLQAAGHEVVLVQTVPYWDKTTTWDPRICSLMTVVTDGCVAHQTLEQARHDRREIRAVISQVAESTSARVWDPGNLICPQGICTTSGAGIVRYRDDSHISVDQSKGLALSVWKLVSQSPE